MDVNQESLVAGLEKIKAKAEACLEKMEANQEKLKVMDLEGNKEEIEVMTEHQKIPNKEAAMETILCTEGPIWGQASGCKTSWTAEQMGPGQCWVPAEVGRRPRTGDPLCHPCMA
jgi:hypothetical protein